jgi:hypothetical protein
MTAKRLLTQYEFTGLEVVDPVEQWGDEVPHGTFEVQLAIRLTVAGGPPALYITPTASAGSSALVMQAVGEQTFGPYLWPDVPFIRVVAGTTAFASLLITA